MPYYALPYTTYRISHNDVSETVVRDELRFLFLQSCPPK